MNKMHLRMSASAAVVVATAPLLYFSLGFAGHGGTRGHAWQGSNPIQHIVIIMQENRSFDSYFGTFPGAEGLLDSNGNIRQDLKVPDPRMKTNGQPFYIRPYHNGNDVNQGAGHALADFNRDVNKQSDGSYKMDGFLQTDTTTSPHPGEIEVMGYHDQREIPNYWAYAKNFVLQDHMFEPICSWSSPCHLYLVSEWSATCGHPLSDCGFACCYDINQPSLTIPRTWNSLVTLLDQNQVSWHYYITPGATPDSDDGSDNYVPKKQNAKTPSIWNPLATFSTISTGEKNQNIAELDDFYSDVQNGTLPQVCWIIPDQVHSEHPRGKISDGQAHVTQAINAIMNSSYWNNTAIFVSWDDWGGFYDHVPPPTISGVTSPDRGYGIRVPGLVISAYAKQGFIDKTVLSFDSYVRLIEDQFLPPNTRIPTGDGRSDQRDSFANSLLQDFDFTQQPRPPLILPTYPQRQ